MKALIDFDIFVFGSNLAGRHGKGAALTAKIEHDAVYGIGEGPTGRAYAIPTKDEKLKVRSLDSIERSVDNFLTYAELNEDLVFQVTRIGCGLAGYSDEEIAPFFEGAPDNCILPIEWKAITEVPSDESSD